jgi:N4-gp56 family major capsid protein
MAVTTTTSLSNSVVTQYEKDFMYFADLNTTWADVIYKHMKREQVGGKGLRGSTINIPIFTDMAEVTASLTESGDVTPVEVDDAYVQLTIAEEGNVAQTTRFLENIAAYYDVGKPIAQMIGKNMAVRRDKIVRNAICFGATDIIYAGAATSRVTLDTTSDTITYAKIAEGVARAKSKGVPPFPDGTYLTVYHPALETELLALASVVNPGYYQEAQVLMDGDFRSIAGKRFEGETYRLAGLRFIPSQYGKLYLGAGTVAQAATTLNGDHAAGATTVNVASAANITAGDYVTIGTLESSTTARHSTEQVYVSAVDTNALTIRGAGTEGVAGNTGLKFAHLSGVAVTESPNVASIPIMGPESAIIAFATDVGWDGEVSLEWAPTQLAKRFINHGWYWVGGAKVIDHNVVVIEAATAGKILGNN